MRGATSSFSDDRTDGYGTGWEKRNQERARYIYTHLMGKEKESLDETQGRSCATSPSRPSERCNWAFYHIARRGMALGIKDGSIGEFSVPTGRGAGKCRAKEKNRSFAVARGIKQGFFASCLLQWRGDALQPKRRGLLNLLKLTPLNYSV